MRCPELRNNEHPLLMIRRIGIQFIYASLALLAGQDEDDKKQNLNYQNISLPATLISCPRAISKA